MVSARMRLRPGELGGPTPMAGARLCPSRRGGRRRHRVVRPVVDPGGVAEVAEVAVQRRVDAVDGARGPPFPSSASASSRARRTVSLVIAGPDTGTPPSRSSLSAATTRSSCSLTVCSSELPAGYFSTTPRTIFAWTSGGLFSSTAMNASRMVLRVVPGVDVEVAVLRVEVLERAVAEIAEVPGVDPDVAVHHPHDLLVREPGHRAGSQASADESRRLGRPVVAVPLPRRRKRPR